MMYDGGTALEDLQMRRMGNKKHVVITFETAAMPVRRLDNRTTADQFRCLTEQVDRGCLMRLVFWHEAAKGEIHRRFTGV